jgi:hypothetical protein
MKYSTKEYFKEYALPAFSVIVYCYKKNFQKQNWMKQNIVYINPYASLLHFWKCSPSPHIVMEL